VAITRALVNQPALVLAITRALVNQPALVLADEPTGALDSTTSHEMMHLLTALNQQGTTIVVVTHDATVAVQTRRVIQMQDGLVVETGKQLQTLA
jgi:putative ABC transport system ATP-binding protein